MKLAACYTLFNGLELLDNSINQIFDCVDEIILCYQKISNKGNVSNEIEAFIHERKGKNKLHILFFEPDLHLNTKENERNKHQTMIDFAKKLNCTHFFLSATDHFYKKNEFLGAKKDCESLDFDVTFTKMYTYYKKYTWQITPIENYLMPFICKLYPETSIVKLRSHPYDKIVVDPSVKIFPCATWYVFEEEEIMMHHYSMVRIDIKNKFQNAAASIRWPNGLAEEFLFEWENYTINENSGVKYFQGRKIKEVPDYFFGKSIFTQSGQL